MSTHKRMIAATELVLIFPAALFMAALVLRNLPPLQSGIAPAAQGLVMWYANRIWTLWVLLIALPIAVLVIGFVTLFHASNGGSGLRQAIRQSSTAVRSNLAAKIIAAMTLAAGIILVIVVIHVLMN